MKIGRRYIAPIFIFLFFGMLGFVLEYVTEYLVPMCYDVLVHLFPDVFKDVSPLTQPMEYEELTKRFTVISVFLIFLVIHYVALRCDNKRFEYIINKTDGQYSMLEGLGLYLENFLVSDLICAVIVPPVLIIPAYFIPVEIMSYGLDMPLWCGVSMMEHIDIVIATVLVIILSVVARFIVIFPTVKVWRAMWLTASVE